MPNLALALQLIETLPPSRPGLFNPWRDWSETEDRGNPMAGPAGRVQRLAAHLDAEPRYIFCGQSPGWRGCRYTGIAFTSERQLLEGVVPRVPRLAQPLTCEPADRGVLSEPAAAVMWDSLRRLGIADEVLLWNALQMHPHRPGVPRSNRTPTGAEVELGAPALELLLETFPDAYVIAIGGKAEALLRNLDLLPNALLQHPAYGGARHFADGLRQVVDRVGARP